MEDLIRIARSRDWRGYFGSPRLAGSERYANGWQIALNEAVKLALRILDGFDDRQVPRFGDEMKKSAPDAALDEASFSHEAGIKRKQEKWLKRKNLR
jgi:hypothetical protein